MSDIYLLSNVKSKEEDIINLPLLKIKFIEPKEDLNTYDALIFTSKNAIFSLENFNIDYKKIPSYAIAPKTAQILIEHNSNLVYTGESSHGNEFANEIKQTLKGKNVLYIRAKKVVSSLEDILIKNSVKCDSLIVYETACSTQKNNVNIKDNSIIIFTSPSTIECFLNKYKWDNSYVAICIGKTTASYLPKNTKYFISKLTSINSCIELARTI